MISKPRRFSNDREDFMGNKAYLKILQLKYVH